MFYDVIVIVNDLEVFQSKWERKRPTHMPILTPIRRVDLEIGQAVPDFIVVRTRVGGITVVFNTRLVIGLYKIIDVCETDIRTREDEREDVRLQILACH
jgi:hypothetical protein